MVAGSSAAEEELGAFAVVDAAFAAACFPHTLGLPSLAASLEEAGLVEGQVQANPASGEAQALRMRHQELGARGTGVDQTWQ